MRKALYFVFVLFLIQIVSFIFFGSVVVLMVKTFSDCSLKAALEKCLDWVLIVGNLCAVSYFIKKKWAFLNWGRILRHDKIILFFISLMIAAAYCFLYDVFYNGVFDHDVLHYDMSEMDNGNSLVYILFVFILLSVIMPLAEELCFRGAVLRTLYERYGDITFAIIFSSLLFAIVHFNFRQGVGAFIIGTLLGWLYYKTNSIIPGLIIHSFNNMMSSVYSYLHGYDSRVSDSLSGLPLYVLIFLSAIVLLSCIMFINNKYKSSDVPAV